MKIGHRPLYSLLERSIVSELHARLRAAIGTVKDGRPKNYFHYNHYVLLTKSKIGWSHVDEIGHVSNVGAHLVYARCHRCSRVW